MHMCVLLGMNKKKTIFMLSELARFFFFLTNFLAANTNSDQLL